MLGKVTIKFLLQIAHTCCELEQLSHNTAKLVLTSPLHLTHIFNMYLMRSLLQAGQITEFE